MHDQHTIVGALFHHERQPHGSLHVRIDRCEPWVQADVVALEALYREKGWLRGDSMRRYQHLVDNGFYRLFGTIESGVTINRIFQHTCARDEAGRAWECDHVSARELAAAHKISVAM
jgi:hypothetical protein